MCLFSKAVTCSLSSHISQYNIAQVKVVLDEGEDVRVSWGSAFTGSRGGGGAGLMFCSHYRFSEVLS